MINNKFEVGKKVYFITTRYEEDYPILEQGIINVIRISESGIEYDLDNGYYSFGEMSLYGSFEEAFDAYKEKLRARLEVNKV